MEDFVETSSLQAVCDTSIARTTGFKWFHAGNTVVRIGGAKHLDLMNTIIMHHCCAD